MTISGPNATATLSVRTSADNADEADASITATVMGGTGYNPVAPLSASVLVEDNDGVNISIADARGGEDEAGDGSAGRVVFTVTLSASPAEDTEVTWETVHDSSGSNPATSTGAGADYNAARGVLTFIAEGTTTMNIAVDVVNDVLVEQEETFLLRLSAPTADATIIGDSEVTGTITSGDVPGISIANAEGSETEGRLVFVVTLNTAPAEDTVVSWETADGGGSNRATSTGAAADYTPASGTLTFTAGSATTMNIIVVVADDDLVEPNETFLVRLTGATNDGNITDGEAVGTITSEDEPEISIRRNVDRVTEGMSATFTVTASPVPFGNLNVTMATSQQGGFIRGTPARTVVIGAGGTATYTINTQEVSGVGTGSVTAIVQPGTGYTLSSGNSSATVAVVDSSVRRVNVAASQANVVEGTDSTVTFTISLNSMPSATGETAVTVDYATEGVSNNPATAGSDYTAASGTVIFAANETSKTVMVNITNDNLYEQFNEQFQMQISNPRPSVSNQIGTSTATVTIADDESLTLSIAVVAGKSSVTEANGNTLEFAVSLAGAAGGVQDDVTVNYTLSGTADADGAAAAGRADYTAPSGSLNFTGTATGQTVVVTVLDDDIAEGVEMVTLTLSQPTAPRVTLATGTTTATGTIIDDEMAVISIAAAGNSTSITEGDDAVFIISSSNSPMDDTSIGLTANQTGSFISAALPDSVTLVGGQISATLTIATVGDMNHEADGSISLRLNLSSELTNAGYSANPNASAATITIVDDDQPSVSISVSPASGVEGTNAVFTITATPVPYAGITLTVPLTVSTVGNFVTGAAAPANVVLTNTAATAIFTIATQDDEVREANGTITATLSTPTSDVYRLGTSSQAVFTVQDNDTPNLSIRATDIGGTSVSSVIEGSTIVFTITSSFAPREDLSVALNATTQGDYFDGPVPPSQTLILATGQSSAAITVNTVNDDDPEGDGSITVTLTAVNASANYAVVAPASAQVVVEDDDGLNEEQVEAINTAVLSDLGIITTDTLNGIISDRITGAVNGTATPQGLTVAGSSIPDFLMKQLQSRHDRREQMRASGEWKPDEPFQFNSRDLNFAMTLGVGGKGEGTGGNTGAAASGSFNLPAFSGLAESTAAGTGAATDSNLTFWGRGFYHSLDSIRDAVDFDGKITGATFGLDLQRSNFIIGAAISDISSEMDFNYQDLDGIHTTNVIAVNPYIAHSWDSGVHLWGTLGFAGGDIEVVEADDINNRYTSSVSMKSAGFGGYGPIFNRVTDSGSKLSLGIIGNGMLSSIEEDNASADSGRVRVGLKLEQRTNTGSGNSFASNATLNYRNDFGDGLTGGGVELGGGLELGIPNSGLQLDLNARTLVSHTENVNEWGVDIGIAWTTGQDGRGLSLTFKPQWGATDSQEKRFWDDSAANFKQSTTDEAGRYNLEMKYGIELAGASAIGISDSENADTDAGTSELLELFFQGDDNRNIKLGANFGLGQNAEMELFARTDLKRNQNFTLGANYAIGETLSIGYEAIMTPSLALGSSGASTTSGTTPNPDTGKPSATRYLPYLRQSTPELNPFGDPTNTMFTLPGMNTQQPSSATTPGLNHRAYLRYEKRF
ncbi:MAG: Calx-beta domain-containing protein [Pseudohongiellaceae bacterium]